MRLRISLVPVLAATALLALTVACGAAVTPAPTPTPSGQSPTPTPVSPEARQTAMEFARSVQSIEQEWDQFHRDFDQWQSGLTACQRSAVEVSLRDFAADFNEVLRQARTLPRSSVTRSVADQLIEAAEAEGDALRQLRDGWQPSNTSLFDALESQRSAAAAAQQEALDKLSDLRESSDPGAVEEAREFSTAFEELNTAWETFHDNYTSLRDQQGDLSAAEMSSGLSDLVEEFSNIVSAVDDLPSADATESMAEQLKQTAEAEDKALKDLRDEFQAQAEASNGAGNSNGPSNSSSSSSNPFATLNGLVSRSDNAREQVQNDLESILEDTAAQKVGDIDTFRQQYDALVQEWSDFHEEYDEWRRTEGGCNRTEVIDQLGQFSVRFGEIAAKARNLPRASYVRPMADTLVEAAEREEEALRVLRNTWRPFATDAYRAVEQEQTNANRLRRQAGVGVQELLDRFGVQPSS